MQKRGRPRKYKTEEARRKAAAQQASLSRIKRRHRANMQKLAERISPTPSDGGKDENRAYVRETMRQEPDYCFLWSEEKQAAFDEFKRVTGFGRVKLMAYLAENWPARHEYELIRDEMDGRPKQK